MSGILLYGSFIGLLCCLFSLPISLKKTLLARITALLHRSIQSSGSSLKSGDLILDEDKQTVTTKDGETHTLTGTEFRLLRYFLLNAGHVLSKSRLTDHLYNLDSDKDSNIIEAYIKRLRKLLGRERIETRRGQGYIFKELPQ